MALQSFAVRGRLSIAMASAITNDFDDDIEPAPPPACLPRPPSSAERSDRPASADGFQLMRARPRQRFSAMAAAVAHDFEDTIQVGTPAVGSPGFSAMAAAVAHDFEDSIEIGTPALGSAIVNSSSSDSIEISTTAMGASIGDVSSSSDVETSNSGERPRSHELVRRIDPQTTGPVIAGSASSDLQPFVSRERSRSQEPPRRGNSSGSSERPSSASRLSDMMLPPAFLDARDLSDLECAVCLDTLCEPLRLPCLHAFCRSCCQSLLSSGAREAIKRCPLCRAPFPSDFDPASALADSALVRLVQHLRTEAETRKVVRLVIGNRHELVSNPRPTKNGKHLNNHRWTVFVHLQAPSCSHGQPSNSPQLREEDLIDRVKFQFAPFYTLWPASDTHSFRVGKNPEVRSVPYEVTRIGWFSFPVMIHIVWKDWVGAPPLDLEHELCFDGSGAHWTHEVELNLTAPQLAAQQVAIEAGSDADATVSMTTLNRTSNSTQGASSRENRRGTTTRTAAPRPQQRSRQRRSASVSGSERWAERQSVPVSMNI